MPSKIVFSRPPKLVSTKTLLLKHYYRRQGKTLGHPTGVLAKLPFSFRHRKFLGHRPVDLCLSRRVSLVSRGFS